jgi:transcriptional regulator with PAS, ATPase and Fis domain
VTDAAPRLIAITGPARGTVWPIGSAATFGREPTLAHVILDPAMSRTHCTIEYKDGSWSVIDHDSRNGTMVNGVPIRSQLLNDGDQVQIGNSILLFTGGEPIQRGASGASDSSTVAAPLVIGDTADTQLTFVTGQQVRHDLVGQSPAMAAVVGRIGRAAATNSTVIIQGESGTGKELVARAIHANSSRANGVFIPINCAAIPDALIESELFGHERGAFTGAVGQKRGLIEAAHGGTLFLDEIGELPIALQPKLLRALQERKIDRVGGIRPVAVDIRIVAATNTDLSRAVKAGSFRGDLYFRLNVVSITMPPLRERAGDVHLLTWYFLRKHAGLCKRRIRGVTREARAVLTRYDWPGNVRELENAIERAVVMSDGDWIGVDDLPEPVLESAPRDEADGYHARVSHAKRETIRKALDLAGGNVAEAARQLKLQQTYLHRLIKNLGLRDGPP